MVDNDPLNRRYTGATVMDLSGPVAHSEFTKTKFSQDGSQARGTLNSMVMATRHGNLPDVWRKLAGLFR